MSPRRSSRARSTQNPSAPSHANSHTSSTKADRSTRSNLGATNRPNSPRRASIARSDSIDDAESSSRSAHTGDTNLPPRRSRRGNDNDVKEKDTRPQPDDEGDPEEEAIEEDVTRCVCGLAEYPGPGASLRDQYSSTEPLSDDIGNFFVQCDKCHVWQHGGCMGLMDESLLQDKDQYYCEQCKPEYHKILKSLNGSRSSRYLPLLDANSNRSSPFPPADASRKNNARRTLEQTKRRATMNSRVAYEEDELLRQAIEESKEMGTLGKRSREDNEYTQRPQVKRQRTGSSVSSGASGRSQSPSLDEHGLARSASGNGGKSSNKLRGSANKSNREKELREKQKEQVAAQRAEAASKRNARSERRRVDESPPPPSPTLSPSKPVQSNNGISKTKVETPPSSKAMLVRKGGRPPARRGRLGRNQYSRDVPFNGDGDSPMRDTSHDGPTDSPRPHTNGNINGESGRSSKAKTHPARTSMNEMKRRVAAILEFVGRMQTERRPPPLPPSSQNQASSSASQGPRSRSSDNASLKGDGTPNGLSAADLPTASLVKAVAEGLEQASKVKKKGAITTTEGNDDDLSRSSSGGDTDRAHEPVLDIAALMHGKDFDGMDSMEMMETLTKDLVTWQSVYGIYAR